MKSNDVTVDSERRKHKRYNERNRVVVTVLSAPNAPSIERQSYFCWTKNLSAEGMRFCVYSPVPAGAILRLEVLFDEPRDMFRHVGEVIWTKDVCEDDVFFTCMGIKITETLGGDSCKERWAWAISRPSQR